MAEEGPPPHAPSGHLGQQPQVSHHKVEFRLIMLLLRVSTNEEVDSIISAEIPADPEELEESKKEEGRRLQSIVITNMIHGPCGEINQSCVCMKDKKCTKNFPKKFCKKTFRSRQQQFYLLQPSTPEVGGESL